MVKEKKLYDLLSVSTDANDADIKKAYRKQALKYHPDKPNGDTEKFKEISEAFDILSNNEKRQLYDNYGLETARRGGLAPEDMGGGPGVGGGFQGGAFPGGAGGGGPFPFAAAGDGGGAGTRTFHFTSGGPGGGGFSQFSTGDAFNIFQNFRDSGGFGDEEEDIFSMLGGGMGGRGHSSGPGAVFGSNGGGGRGGRSKAPPEKSTVTIKLPVSLEDLAKGVVKKMKIKRRRQSGTEEKILEVSIKPGWKAGTKVTFANEGDMQPNGATQDVVFVIEEKPNPQFTRDGNNLESSLELELKEALCGFSKVVNTIDGKRIKVESRRPTPPGQIIKYPSHGMPISKNPGQRGDLILKVKVNFPTTLTLAQQKAIQDNF